MEPSKVKKIILIIVAVVAVISVAVIAAVLISIINRKPGQNVSTTGTDVIRIWGLWENEDVMNSGFSSYLQSNPTIKISYTNREDIKQDYKATLKKRLEENNSQSVPDIVMVHHTWIDEFSKYLSPMPSSIYSDSTLSNTFIPNVGESVTRNNQSYGLPVGFDAIGVYYNKKLLGNKGYSAPEVNWDQFRDQAKKLTIKDKSGKITVSGVALGTSNNIDFFYETLSMLMLQNGATMTNPEGTATTFGTDPLASQALKFYTDFTFVDGVWDKTLPRDITMFAEGKLAMMFAPLWRADSIKKANPALDFDIAPVPQLNNLSGTTRIDYADYWVFAVPNVSVNKTISWDLLKSLSSPDPLKAMYQTAQSKRVTGQFYPRIDMLEELKSQQYTDAYTTMASTAKTWKMYDKESVQKIFKKELDAALSVSSSVQTSNVLSTIATQVDEILKQNTNSTNISN